MTTDKRVMMIDISAEDMVLIDGTAWGLGALRNALKRADECQCEGLKSAIHKAEDYLVNGMHIVQAVHVLKEARK